MRLLTFEMLLTSSIILLLLVPQMNTAAAAEIKSDDETDSDTPVVMRDDAGAEIKEYVVEKIIISKEDNGKKMYRVKWKGWSAKYNTWEPLTNLTHCPQIIAKFEQQSAKKKRHVKKLKF